MNTFTNLKRQYFYLLLLLTTLLYGTAMAQTSCSINAGGNAIVCGSTTTLTGATVGERTGNPTWTFVSGPVTPTIVSPNTFVTDITGMTTDGDYVFEISQTCVGGEVVSSQVTITAHPRPASFTAGPDITNVCATVGSTNLGGVIPPGYTGVWTAVNIYSKQRYNTTVSTNSTFSDPTIADPVFSLIKKADHDIDPAYYVTLKITSNDGVCSYEDSKVVRFIPNPMIEPRLNTSHCVSTPVGANSYYVFFGSTGPRFVTLENETAGNPAYGTTVTLTTISQPAGGNISLKGTGEDRIYFDGIDVTGPYSFTLTVSNACGTYTTPPITYDVSGFTPLPVNFALAAHPDQLVIYTGSNTGGEFHSSAKIGSTAPESFYFEIDPQEPSSTVSNVHQSGMIPPGGATSVSVLGAGTYQREAVVTPPAGGWQVGTYEFSVETSHNGTSCIRPQRYYIHVSDGNRPDVTVDDLSICYPGTGAISATVPLPAVYQGVVNSSYFQDFVGRYDFTLISSPAGAATPTYSTNNLRSLTSTSTVIGNFNKAGDYRFRITAVPLNSNVGPYLELEYADSGTSLTSEFTITVENLINANAGSDQSILCPESVSLIGNSPGVGTGQWTVSSAPSGATPVFANSNSNSTTVSGLSEEGNYEFAWQITTPEGGCTSSDIVQVTRTCALPVRLISFEAKNNGENASILEWSTASEQNSKGFSVERSTDAKHWETIAFVSSVDERGNSFVQTNYEYTDKRPYSGMNYYRLKQVDFDDSYAYSRVSSVEIQSALEVKVFPNPANDRVSISGLYGDEQIVISNAAGQKLKTLQVDNDEMTLDLRSLGEGIYVLQVRSQNHIHFAKKILIAK
ncbi:putative secreted protein (Por secretion system target) [Dyadobacter jejuensis]|uniref:Putative secreted protein (Por secretion system target) n=1 Tax=Dyadobacter jejuensis TaxID=1082580 RepID=A0A316AGX6_9BACT|nr:T9SS type A sorting domain-containing protein [Dyadobacter jejuensis]PWJ56902.1 putative secreted protein (Por secretion system target) [Dyadobacter jejuensis]